MVAAIGVRTTPYINCQNCDTTSGPASTGRRLLPRRGWATRDLLLSLGGLGQGLRIVRQRVQISDHVGALAAARQAGEGHGRSGDKPLRIGQELVQVLDGPAAALALHRRRVVEP